MKKAEFWYQNRHLLNGQVKCDSTQQALLLAGESYPYFARDFDPIMSDDIDMDALGGDNFRGFLKMLKKFVRTLNASLPDGIKPIFSKARIDTSYYAKVGNKKVHYYPVVIEFDDGQYLVGLARQYGEFADDPHIARDEEIRITKWILNGKDITPAIYKTKEDIASENPSVIAKKIAVLVEKNHPQFVKKFPQKQINTKEEIEAKKQELQKEIEELKKQIEELKTKIENNQEENNEESQKVFDEVKNIIVESSELSDETNKKFNSFKDLQYWIVEKSAENGIVFEDDSAYYKVWLQILMSNGEDELELSPRVDISFSNINDFNPLEEYIVDYLEERYSDGVKTSEGNFKVDFSQYKITEEEWKKMIQDFQKIIEEAKSEEEDDIESKLNELLKSDDPDYINEELDKIVENMSDEEIAKYEDLLNEVNDRAVELASKEI